MTSTTPRYIEVISASRRIVDHLRASPRDKALLQSRLANVGRYEGYRMTIADICPNLATQYYDGVAEAVSQALRNERRRPAKAIRGRVGA